MTTGIWHIKQTVCDIINIPILANLSQELPLKICETCNSMVFS